MEDQLYPGYANIDFQVERGFLFLFFRADLGSMQRFSSVVRDFLRTESEWRRKQLGTVDTRAWAAQREKVDRAAELGGTFVDLLLSSMVVAIYGRFEAFLADLCRAIHEKGVYGEDPGFIKNIDDSKKYLKKVPGMKFPAGSKAWCELKDLGELRHVIVHNNRILRTRRKKQREAIQRIPCVRVNERDEVWVEDGLLEHTVKTLNAFTGLLENALGPTGQLTARNE